MTNVINSFSYNDNIYTFTLPYGVCSTGAGATEKVVTVDNFSLEEGAVVIVKFTNKNDALNPTLNVNGTGAKPIYRYGTTNVSTETTSTGWIAGAIQLFIYDGTGWIRDYWSNTTYSNASLGQGYATCSTAASTKEKTASLSSYSLTTGGIVAVKFTNDVCADATLNINSKGAKKLYFRGAAITEDIIKAGDVATFIYDTNYHLISIDRWQNDIINIKTDLEELSEDLTLKANITYVDEQNTQTLNSAKAYTDQEVAGLVNSAPETLDTLNELAQALGDDPNFATTVANQIGLKMDKTNPIGTGSFSLNRKANSTIGQNSFAVGTNITASGSTAHAEGTNTTASGYASHAEGINTVASGSQSHAEGNASRAEGNCAHAEGQSATASGSYSHAEGYLTNASKRASHAEGEQTLAYSSYQHVQGKFNIGDSTDTYAHIVGNGPSLGQRSNAHTLDWSGNAWYAGDVYVGSTSGKNKDEGSKKLATEEYVNSIPETAIIDVAELPSENINEKMLYRLCTSKFASSNESLSTTFIAHTVETLPETDILSVEIIDETNFTIHAYYVPSEQTLSIYLDERADAIITDTTYGWHSFDTFAEVQSIDYGGIINSNNEATDLSKLYLILDYELYSYKNKWNKLINDTDIMAIPQSDWNQNDENAQDYIKNRTHWADEEWVLISDEFRSMMIFIPIETDITNGLTKLGHYRFTVDNTDVYLYEKTTEDKSSRYCIGGASGDNLPFKIERYNGGPEGYILRRLNKMVSSFKVEYLAQSIKQLDDKYISSSIARTAQLIGQASSEGGEIFNDYENNSANSYSHAEGYKTTASGNYSHTEGQNTIASGESSHAEGRSTEASGDNSHAEGSNTVASGDYSHVEGGGNDAVGDYSHAEGANNRSTGSASHTEGSNNKATATSSHAEGSNTEASGEGSHAEGYETKALEVFAHAEGFGTTASGEGSHAEGGGSIASGYASHAEGQANEASGYTSHAEGQYTKASGGYQHVQGRYNVEDSESIYAHIVGNGDYDGRSNAHTLDWQGNAWFAGDIYVGSTSGRNKDEGSKKLATEEFITTEINTTITDYYTKSQIDSYEFITIADIDEICGKVIAEELPESQIDILMNNIK